MTRHRRALVVAAAVSIGLHLAAFLGVPPLEWVRGEAPAAVPPLAVRVIPPPRPALTASKPAEAVAARPARVRPAAAQARPERAHAGPAQAPVVPSYEYPVLDAPAAGAAIAEGPASAPDAAATAGPSPPTASEQDPVPEYRVRRAQLVFDLYFGASATKVGQVTHTWTHDGERYDAETVAEAVGFVSLVMGGRFVQRSRGTVTANGLAPSEYRAELGSADRTESAQFDWAGGKLRLTSKGEQRLVDLPPGAQDPLSALHQLYFMRPIPQASRLQIATGRKLYRYVYQLVGETELETPIGIVRALQLQRRDPDGARMDVWLDLDRELVPARIHAVDRRGMVLEQVIREARLDVIQPPK